MPTNYQHYEFKGSNYLLMGYVLSTSYEAASDLFARVTGAPRDRVNTLSVKYTDMPVSENTIFPSDADESRPHNMLERDQSGKRFHLNPEPENKKAGQDAIVSTMEQFLGLPIGTEVSVQSAKTRVYTKQSSGWRSKDSSVVSTASFGPAIESGSVLIKKAGQEPRKRPAFGSEEPDVSTSALEGILLHRIGSNATLPSGVEVVGFENAASEIGTLIDKHDEWLKANQPSTDDVVVPRKTARDVNLLLKFLLQQTAHRYITERQEKHVIRAFDDLVNPKKTRTFHVEVTGTRYDLERALENIRKVSNANSLRASISEDTE
jgi:hypothetical protein